MIRLLGRRVVIAAFGLNIACFCSPARTASERVDTKPAVTARWVCSADQDGDWYNMPCPSGNCRARCSLINYCEPKAVSSAIAACSHDATCTPLVLHRRLARLGCGFNADSFWTNPEARPVPITATGAAIALKAHPGKAPLKWSTPSCEEAVLKGIEKELNDATYLTSTTGRSRAFEVLLKRGCNVDLAQMGPDGEYANVTLTRHPPVRTDESGTAPQPPVTVAFIPQVQIPLRPVLPTQPVCDKEGEEPVCVDVTVPQRPIDVGVCDALRLLHDSKHFALCNAGTNVRNVHIRFLPKVEGPDKFTERVQIDAASDGKVDGSYDAEPSPNPPSPSSTVSLPTAAAGSAGVGALLATLATRIFGRLKKKTGPDQPPAEATHAIQDVQITVAFRHPPRPPRVREAKSSTSSPDTRA
ncbi:hypothetical protein ACMX25_16920 [Caballeronia sp. 15715]|uniref:hypothetical protein n=1 Tax=Caballeronia sp. 15715 TaxID=3391030 RepID=UPI0039E5DF8A